MKAPTQPGRDRDFDITLEKNLPHNLSTSAWSSAQSSSRTRPSVPRPERSYRTAATGRPPQDLQGHGGPVGAGHGRGQRIALEDFPDGELGRWRAGRVASLADSVPAPEHRVLHRMRQGRGGSLHGSSSALRNPRRCSPPEDEVEEVLGPGPVLPIPIAQDWLLVGFQPVRASPRAWLKVIELTRPSMITGLATGYASSTVRHPAAEVGPGSWWRPIPGHQETAFCLDASAGARPSAGRVSIFSLEMAREQLFLDALPSRSAGSMCTPPAHSHLQEDFWKN